MINKHMHNVTEKEIYEAYKLFFNSLSSEIRLKILNLLRKKSMNVGEIIQALKIDQTNVSHNLERLKSCRFVNSEKKGKYRKYSINKKTILPILEFIDKHMEENCLMIIKSKRKNDEKKNNLN